MKVLSTKLQVHIFKEGNQFIAYCPAFDISTSADTFDEVKKNFEELLDVFIKEVMQKGTLEEVLLDCGWQKVKTPRLHWQPPQRQFIAEIEEEVNLPCPT